MRDWVPAGSKPYDTAFAVGPYTTEAVEDDGTSAYFSTIPYRGPKVRDPKQCKGNEGTCKGFKSGGTDFCVGHRKQYDKAVEAAAAILAAEQAKRDASEHEALVALGFVTA